MDIKSFQNTQIFKELPADVSVHWFHRTDKKFIHNIDTLYYSVKVDHKSQGFKDFVAELKSLKESAEEKNLDIPYQLTGYFVRPYLGFRMYKYSISNPDFFDIFVAENLPNDETPSIFVQLRSQFLWIGGVQKAIDESLNALSEILAYWELSIQSVMENRIDFAYHTNYIQDLLSFFAEKHLRQMHIGGFVRWSKEGYFLGDDIYTDYISLGRRKSNNVFLRIYNKSKEVIELNYKQFFVYIWHEKGLISNFDRWLFEKLFESDKSSWNAKDRYRLLFYIENGADERIKAECKKLYDNPYASSLEMNVLANKLVPDLTNITNIEFQTKRKFFVDFQFPPRQLPTGAPPELERLQTVLSFRRDICDYLTDKTIRFVNYKGEFENVRRSDRPVADWWNRLRSCQELNKLNSKLAKEYQQKFDKNRYKCRMLNNFATFTAHSESPYKNPSLYDDVSEFLTEINDNDIRRYCYQRFVKKKEVKRKFKEE